MTNFNDLEPIFIARLREQLAADFPEVGVSSAPSQDDAGEWSVAPPQVFVMSGGETVADSTISADKARQRMAVVIATKSARGMADGGETRLLAGRLKWAVYAALRAWVPGVTVDSPCKKFSPVQWDGNTTPRTTKAFILLTPMAFSVNFVLNA